ncbi:MAG: hypothetical protein L3J43_03535 [Sulfurovum sp.]|nr:hypothetical protein [Sulfurovum sp.]
MKINIFHIFLVMLYLISSSFFGLMTLPLLIHDGILIILILVFLVTFKQSNQYTIYEDRYFHYFFFYAFLSTLVMAYLNYAQPVLYSVRAARIMIVFMLLLMSLNVLLRDFAIKKAHSFMYLITFLIIFINVYVYVTGDISILAEGQGVLERLGEVRVTIGAFTSIILILYFYHGIKENKWFIVPLISLLFTVIVVAKTRSVIFPLLIIMLLPLFRVHKAEALKVWLGLLFIVLVSFIVSGYEKSIVSPIVDLVTLLIEEFQTEGHSNVNIRGLELLYFWDFLDTKSIIFGYGMDNKLFRELYQSHYFLEDIGIFKVFYLHGIIGFILFVIMHWRLYKVSKYANTSLHLTGRGIVYFQILSPSSVFLYIPEYMILFFIVYVLIKNTNKKIG